MIVYASRPHYRDHLAPVAARTEADVALVASYHDLCKARTRKHSRIVLMQHGCGQSYSNDNPGLPGGRDNDDVGLFLVPNEQAGRRWRARYPAARVEVVGTPRLDDLPRREPDGLVTVATTFHWHGMSVPESRDAFAHYSTEVRALARTHHVIGHGHPRATWLPAFYRKHGIEWVADFMDVCRRADLLIFDNTSAGFEFAATGRPVVVLNAPGYRRDVEHGLRFWEASGVGVNVWPGDDLGDAVAEALEDAPERKAAREDALGITFGFRSGAAQRAADVIEAWAA